MTAQLHSLPRRPAPPGLGVYPYEVGSIPKPPDVDDDLLAEFFAEGDELDTSRGIMNAILISAACFFALGIGVWLGMWVR